MSEFKQKILEQLENIEKLPTLPEVITRLMEVLQNPDSCANDVAKILADDPAIMSRVLKVSNSSFYGNSQSETDNIHIATVRLGYKMISDIAISTSVFSIFPKDKEQKSLNRHEFWKHCIYMGYISKAIIKISRCKKWDFNLENVTLIGLLHDIGIIVMEEYFNDFFVQILNYAIDKKLPLLSVEKAVLGVQHAEMGAWLAKKWKLDEEFSTCIKFYHTPELAPPKYQQLSKLLAAAKYICLENGLGHSDINAPFIINDSLWDDLEIDQAQIPDILAMALEQSTLSDLLKVV
jgi:putative nucleotidyltransferase with HDIG domain